MIYIKTDPSEPIRQGDIFQNVPRVDLSLDTILVTDETPGSQRRSWQELIGQAAGMAVTATLPIKPVSAIVITQSCDAARADYITLCQIDPFLVATNKEDSPPSGPKAWQSLILKTGRDMARLFYLPAAAEFGLNVPMAAELRITIRVQREDLEALRSHRIGKLNEVANEHFRESLAHFYARYALNEWYPLTKEEFLAYAASKKDEVVKPYDWQT